jgi:methionyl-tRNA synthetase
MASIEDFSKIELRVGKVMDAELVEGSDKLYKLTVRLGEETRSIVSGIAEFYAVDELMGKKIIVITNLEPRKIRGVESNGMLLAAEKDGQLALATVDQEIPDGALVH